MTATFMKAVRKGNKETQGPYIWHRTIINNLVVSFLTRKLKK